MSTFCLRLKVLYESERESRAFHFLR